MEAQVLELFWYSEVDVEIQITSSRWSAQGSRQQTAYVNQGSYKLTWDLVKWQLGKWTYLWWTNILVLWLGVLPLLQEGCDNSYILVLGNGSNWYLHKQNCDLIRTTKWKYFIGKLVLWENPSQTAILSGYVPGVIDSHNANDNYYEQSVFCRRKGDVGQLWWLLSHRKAFAGYALCPKRYVAKRNLNNSYHIQWW